MIYLIYVCCLVLVVLTHISDISGFKLVWLHFTLKERLNEKGCHYEFILITYLFFVFIYCFLP